MKTILSLLAAATALVAVPASAAELVTNGNFENGSLSGWTATGNVQVAAIPYFGLAGSNYGNFAAAFNGGDSTPNGTLSQAIATGANSVYTFAFTYGVTDNGNQSIIASIIDAASQAVLSSTTVSTTSQSGQRFSVNFIARSNSSIVRFSDFAGNNTASQDIGIDNVSVSNAVPEPATWAMMMLGFGGLGYAMRRSKRRATVRFA